MPALDFNRNVQSNMLNVHVCVSDSSCKGAMDTCPLDLRLRPVKLKHYRSKHRYCTDYQYATSVCLCTFWNQAVRRRTTAPMLTSSKQNIMSLRSLIACWLAPAARNSIMERAAGRGGEPVDSQGFKVGKCTAESGIIEQPVLTKPACGWRLRWCLNPHQMRV